MSTVTPSSEFRSAPPAPTRLDAPSPGASRTSAWRRRWSRWVVPTLIVAAPVAVVGWGGVASAHDSSSHPAAPVRVEKVPARCIDDPGASFVTVAWTDASGANPASRTRVTAYVLDASNTELGHTVVDVDGRGAGSHAGQVRVRIDPRATVSRCAIGVVREPVGVR